MLKEKMIFVAWVIACTVAGLFVIIGGTTLMDRGERYHCARYRAES